MLGNSRGSTATKIFEEDLGLKCESESQQPPREILHLSDFLHDSTFVFVEVSTYLWARKSQKRLADSKFLNL